METSMAQTDQGKQWYLAVGERSIGPLTTELVVRGIRSGKVPSTAWACQVGATQWSALSSFGEFREAMAPEPDAKTVQVDSSSSDVEFARYGRSPFGLGASDTSALDADNSGSDTAPSSVIPAAAVAPEFARSSPSEHADDTQDSHSGYRVGLASETTELRSPSQTPRVRSKQSELLPYEQVERSEEARESLEFATSADVILGPGYVESKPPSEALPAFGHEAFGGEVSNAADASAQHDELAIDITFDEEHEHQINWLERFQSYFLVGTEVELPDEAHLLRSLRETPRSVFLHDEALWNLALCLAFGSDEVASSSATTFFDAIDLDHGDERIEWVCRTLLSKGFMPSGIPRSDGMRGIDVLRGACPAELRAVLEREAVD